MVWLHNVFCVVPVRSIRVAQVVQSSQSLFSWLELVAATPPPPPELSPGLGPQRGQH